MRVAQRCHFENEMKVRAFFALARNEIYLFKWKDAKTHLRQAKRLIDTYDLNLFEMHYAVLNSMVLRNEKQNVQALNTLIRVKKYLEEYAPGILDRFNYELELAKVYSVLDRQAEALSLLLKLEKEADQLSLLAEQTEIAKALSQVYFNLGKFKLALDQEKKFHTYYEKELGIQRQIRFKEIEQKFKATIAFSTWSFPV